MRSVILYCFLNGLVISLMVVTVSYATSPKAWHFNPDFLAQAHNNSTVEPIHIANTCTENKPEQPPTDAQPEKPLMSYATAHKAIDVMALSYVLYGMAKLYMQSKDTANIQQSWFTSIVQSACPSILTHVGSRIVLIAQLLGIIIETLTYKTIAKLILLCGQGDLFDIFKQHTKKGGHFTLMNRKSKLETLS